MGCFFADREAVIRQTAAGRADRRLSAGFNRALLHGKPHRKAQRASRESRGKWSQDCARISRPQTCAGLCPPNLPQGGDNRPGVSCQRDCQFPESAYINIIPSGLCNSSQDRHLSASRVSRCIGQEPAATVLQAAG